MNSLRCKYNSPYKYGLFLKELYSLINDHLIIVSEEDTEVLKETKPVRIATYLRTDYDNLIVIDTNKEGQPFARIFDPVYVPSKAYPSCLYDLGIMTSKNYVDDILYTSAEGYELLANKSSCFPVGALETEEEFIIVFNAIMSCELVSNEEVRLDKGYKYCPIEKYKPEDAIQEEIAKSLAIVSNKEEN